MPRLLKAASDLYCYIFIDEKLYGPRQVTNGERQVLWLLNGAGYGIIVAMIHRVSFLLRCLVLLGAVEVLHGQTPGWIWHSQTSAPTVFFRKTFRTPPLIWNSRLTVTADDSAEVYLNGVLVAHCQDWKRPLRSEVTVRLHQGENVIAARGRNSGENAGLLVHLNLGGETNIVSDESWLVSTREEANWAQLGFNAAHWERAVVVAPHGEEPWGDVLFKSSATPAEGLKVPAGFRAELLRSAEAGEGSWICVAFDDRGRLIVSPEGDRWPLLRMTLEDGRVGKVEPIQAPIRYAMGLLQANRRLYANARGPQGSGFYELVDKNENDQYETNELSLIKAFEGGSEHGYHALAMGPDNKIYILNGNGTKLPEGISPESPHRHYAEDAVTGADGSENDQDGSKAPACYVLRYDPQTEKFDLFAGGMRNAYDFDFNADGELFTFDSDMEWDWGTPWYKPTRILHLVSGGEYGWRDGTRMWSDDYEDGLPPVAYIGIGSPTGVKFGTRSHFPPKYRKALFAMDWSYGRIVAVHLEPNRSSYTGSWETFLEGKPLNLTSLAFGPDGAMYFVTGGRGTQSGLYRVSYTGGESADALRRSEAEVQAMSHRELRHRLEALHGRNMPESIQFIWPQFELKDRYARFAAAVALESQNVAYWRNRALEEKNPEVALQVLRCLARVSGPDGPEEIYRALQRFPVSGHSEAQQIRKVRILQILLSRHGNPPAESARRIGSELTAIYPASSSKLNGELSRVLLRLNAPGAIRRTIGLLKAARIQEEQMHYVELLRGAEEGWTTKDRREFLAWFNKPRDPKAHPPEILKYFREVGRSYVDGAYFDKYLRDFRREAIAALTPEERAELQDLITAPVVQAQNIPASSREFVREWKMADLLPELEGARTPNLERGRQAFVDGQCLACHRFGNDGGMAGPELTGAGSKYTARDLLESIIEPSKVLSDQYQNHLVILKDGDVYTGRLLGQSDKEVTLETDRVTGAKEKFERSKVEALRRSPLSPMPEGLVNILSKEEILDMIAYLRAPAK